MKETDYFPYEDIIDLPHPISKIHRPMALADRAAQFNPFAALNGYDDEIREAARFTSEKILLAEDEKQALDKKLQALLLRIEEQPDVEVVYFAADEKKSGGSYQTVQGTLKKMDMLHPALILQAINRKMNWGNADRSPGYFTFRKQDFRRLARG